MPEGIDQVLEQYRVALQDAAKHSADAADWEESRKTALAAAILASTQTSAAVR